MSEWRVTGGICNGCALPKTTNNAGLCDDCDPVIAILTRSARDRLFTTDRAAARWKAAAKKHRAEARALRNSINAFRWTYPS